ncbi:Adaptor protein complex AP-1 gamma subunit [Neoconidiobolus thromboides FSU 785]|nr:Adaptor protein complex AP-1 gamma subunit [Neoconidiobolus thromboides FSU 785]
MGYGSLKELIRAIRSCKTAAEERSVIQKESAYLRTAFKEEHVDIRLANVSKLLYIHMLGYPAHFGQIECLKLVASGRYADKRLGYLGISLLIDENQETLTLVTNSLKNDMNHANMYIVGLALSTLGNIASKEVAQDLTDEIEKLLESSNSYIRKKAALCAIRVINKVPDLYEQYIEKSLALIQDKSHGVMLTGVTLIEEMCQINEDIIGKFKQAIPVLVRRLKALATTSSFLPELDVNGVTDPFLQVKILKLLKILGENDVNASESMNDVLAQVATNTDSSKNAGNSILYETVVTIMDIESDSDLRLMAINILGKFLANKDNNTRYVALTTLQKAVAMDISAVQRHLNTILECLSDPDISIRRRALDLAFALIDENNIRVLTREILVFLESADNELKQDTAIQICVAAERFAPNRRWHIDTIVRVLKLAGNFVNEDIVASLTRLISQSGDLHEYSAKKLFNALEQDSTQESLVLVAVWTVGEFAKDLIQGSDMNNEENGKIPTPEQVIFSLETISKSELAYRNSNIQQYLVTSLMKLTSRFSNQMNSNELNQRIASLLRSFTRSSDVEVQQRALEYLNILKTGDIGVAVFEPMPAQMIDQSRLAYRANKKKTIGSQRKRSQQQNGNSRTNTNSEANLLLDLLGDSNPTSSPIQSSSNTNTNSLVDLLGDVSLNTNTQSTMTSSSTNNVMDLLNSSNQSQSNNTSPKDTGYLAYNKKGLIITLSPEKDNSNPNVMNILTKFQNQSGSSINQLQFQVAVPKSQRVQLQPPSSSEITPNGNVTQLFRVANPSKVPIRLRLRIGFNINGENIMEVVEFSGFPESLV